MNLLIALFAGLLFFVLSPNVFLRLPKNGNKFTVAGVHAVIFALVLFLFQSLIFRTFGLREGMTKEECHGTWDPTTKTCHEGFQEGAGDSHDCPNGQHWDGNKCVEGFTEGAGNTHDCPNGQHWDEAHGACV